jgi:hypothetical protein
VVGGSTGEVGSVWMGLGWKERCVSVVIKMEVNYNILIESKSCNDVHVV